MPELILTKLQPKQKYSVQVVAKDENGQTAQSNVLVFTTPSATLTASNSVVQQYLYASAGLYSASNMFINGSGIFAYKPGQALSASTQTVAIEANTGNAYFAGTIFAQSGSIGGFFIGPDYLYGPTSGPFVGLSTTGTYSMFAGATASTGAGALFSVTPAGSLTAVSGSVGGWELSDNSLVNGKVGLYAPLNPQDSDVAIFAGSAGANRINAPFRVDYAGNLIATSASITGNITANSGSIGGFVINNNNLANTGSTIVLSSTTGLTLGSASQFKVNLLGELIAQSASIVGRITAQSGSITGLLAISSTGQLLIGSLTTGNFVTITGSGITGASASIPVFTLPTDGSSPTIGQFRIVQTGLQGIGQVNATGASTTLSSSIVRFPPSVASTLWAGMSLYGGGISANSIITSISGGSVSVSIAASATNNTGFTASGIPNANMLVGVDVDNNITIRGQNAPGVPGAIFTRTGGSSTSSATGSGFYLDNNGILNIGSKLKWNGSLLTVEGSGSFSGSIVASAGYIGGANGWKVESASLTGGTSGSTVGLLVPSANGGIAIFAGDSNPANAKFYVTNTGSLVASSASISGTINANSGSVGGWAISTQVLSSGTGSSLVGLSTKAIAIFAGGSTPNGISQDPSFESIVPITQASNFFNPYPLGSTNRRWLLGNGSGSSVITAASTNTASQVYHGTKALRIQKNATSSNIEVNSLIYATSPYSSDPDEWETLWKSQFAKTFSAYIKSSSGSVTVTLRVGYFNPSTSSWTYSYSSSSVVTTNWNRISVSIPAGYNFGNLGFLNQIAGFFISMENANSGDIIFVDAAKVEIGETPFELYSSTAANFYVNSDGSLVAKDASINNAYIGYSSSTGNITLTNLLANPEIFDIDNDGSYNLAIGSNPYNLNGNSNTVIGNQIINSANGNNNTLIGYGISLSPNLNGVVVIGRDSGGTAATATANNEFVLGTSNHKVLIPGTASVAGNLAADGILFGTVGSFTRNVITQTNPALTLNADPITIAASTLWRAMTFQRGGINSGYLTVSSGSTTAPGLIAASDYRLKTNIEEVNLNLMSSIIKSLKPVTYNEIGKENELKKHGFVAHEVQEYIPEAVQGSKDATDDQGNIEPQTLNQAAMIPYLVAALKDSIIRIEALEQEIALLKGQ